MRGPHKKSTLRARSPRRRSTRAEWVLWLQLRDRRFGGFKFARQQPIGRYYVDFVCREQRLIIEVDGGQHADSPADEIRDAYLATLGYRIFRVWNNDVLANIEGVLQTLTSALEEPLTLSLVSRGSGRMCERAVEQQPPVAGAEPVCPGGEP